MNVVFVNVSMPPVPVECVPFRSFLTILKLFGILLCYMALGSGTLGLLVACVPNVGTTYMSSI